MYDDEDTSSLVSSKILNLSIKNQTGDSEIKKMTYTQKVAPANLVVIDTSIYANRDDASGFTYHSLVYANTKNDICLVVRPTNIGSLKKYDIYLRFGSYVDILNKDLKISVHQKNNWVSCIKAERLFGHVGNIQIGVEYKGKGK